MPSHVVDQKIIILNIEITSNLEERENHPEQELKTVIICDDDQDTLNLFGKALKSKYNVILVGSGEACISKYIEQTNLGKKIHLLLLDYRLDSGISGMAVARKIKEYGGTRTILISAYTPDAVLLKELEESNCIAIFVKKPIYLSSLIELVSDTINQIHRIVNI